MSEWITAKLGELYEVHNGLSKGGKFFGSGYPFLTFSTVFNNYFIPDVLTDLVQSTDAEQNSYSIKRGDVFVTRTSETSDELGMSCVALKDYPNATYNGFTKRMRPITNQVLPEYIGYYMRMPSFRGEFQAFSTMTTRASLKNEDLLSLEVRLPSLERQRRISNVLLDYDSLIKNNMRQIALLEEAGQRLFKEWFVDMHFPGHDRVHYKNGIPEGWKNGKAEDFFSITIGKTPPRAEKKWFVGGNAGVSWASISDMGNAGTFIFVTTEGLTNDAVEKHNMKVVPEGTILLSFKLTLGRVSITTKPMCTNEAIAHFRIENKEMREYTYSYLKNFEYDTLGNTSSISKAVNSKIIKAMPFVIPDDATLRAYSRALAPVLDNIYSKQRQNLSLLEARDRLLPKLMSGEIEL